MDLHLYARSPSLRIFACVRQQQRTASDRLETTHVSTVLAGHIDGAVQHNLRSSNQVVRAPAKDRWICDLRDRIRRRQWQRPSELFASRVRRELLRQ
jgi:hypothetical protein